MTHMTTPKTPLRKTEWLKIEIQGGRFRRSRHS